MGKARTGAAWLDELHPDAEGAQFIIERLRQTLDGEFPGAVGRQEGDPNAAGKRGDVDDQPGLAWTHVRRRNLADGRHADHIDLKVFAQLREAHALKRAAQADAGVVDNHIDSPEPLFASLEGSGDRRRVSDIKTSCQKSRIGLAAGSRTDKPAAASAARQRDVLLVMNIRPDTGSTSGCFVNEN